MPGCHSVDYYVHQDYFQMSLSVNCQYKLDEFGKDGQHMLLHLRRKPERLVWR